MRDRASVEPPVRALAGDHQAGTEPAAVRANRLGGPRASARVIRARLTR